MGKEGDDMKDWTGNSKSTYTMLGASNHSDHEREDNDFYATDPKALELLLDLEEFDPYVWEPACGKGHLSEVLKKRGYIVRSTDLIDRGYGTGNVDFLKTDTPFNGDIITNPPYKYAQEFVEHALSLIQEGNRVAMFLKLTFLETEGRAKLFGTAPPPSHICVSSQVAMCNGRRVREIQEERHRSRLRMVYLGKRLQGRTCCEVV
jgi:hypothetical protein